MLVDCYALWFCGLFIFDSFPLVMTFCLVFDLVLFGLFASCFDLLFSFRFLDLDGYAVVCFLLLLLCGYVLLLLFGSCELGCFLLLDLGWLV